MIYDVSEGVVRLGVEELCERALLSGDLDLRPGKRRFPFRRSEHSARVIQKLQTDARVKGDLDLPLCETVFFEDLVFEIVGCAEGVLYGDPITVEGVRTVTGKHFPSAVSPFFDAYLRCHAYLLCHERGFSRIRTRVTYYRAEDGELRQRCVEYSRDPAS